MGRKIRILLAAVLLGVLLFSLWSIWGTFHEYQANQQLYQDAAAQYTSRKAGRQENQDAGEGLGREDSGTKNPGTGAEEGGSVGGLSAGAPITVDFQGLWEVTQDVVGWIYCEDTVINYPVLKGEDNDTYLRHAYDGSYSEAGCIFIEEKNRPGLADANIIIYGHNMNDGSMFADLKKWTEEDFYQEHPSLWLVTPRQDYRIDIFACYVTSGYSDTYTIFTGPCRELEDYLENCREQSLYPTESELNPEAHYVVLSTCSYVFEDARTVIHGILVPVERED